MRASVRNPQALRTAARRQPVVQASAHVAKVVEAGHRSETLEQLCAATRQLFDCDRFEAYVLRVSAARYAWC